jgi:hypothetical protein
MDRKHRDYDPEVQAALNRFKIEPLQSMLHPVLYVGPAEGPGIYAYNMLHLNITVPDRNNGLPIRIQHLKMVDREHILHAPGVVVRELLRTALMHELDESLTVDGVRVWDPHAKEEMKPAITGPIPG